MKYAVLGLMFMSAAVYAGEEREGHGGKVWECTDAQTGAMTRELSDFQRARERWGLTIDQGQGQTVDEKIEYMLSRFEKVEPLRARMYREKVKTFAERAAFLSDTELYDLRDSFELGSRSNCKLRVVVNQAPNMPTYAFDKKNDKPIRFWVNKDLFESLDAATKAGLILHEIVYEDALNQGLETADPAIYVNALIESTVMDSMTVKQWSEVRKETGFKPFVCGAYAAGVTYFENGMPNTASFNSDKSVQCGTYQIMSRDEGNSEDSTSFYEDGKLRYAMLTSQPATIDGIEIPFITGRTYFWPDGAIKLTSVLGKKSKDRGYDAVSVPNAYGDSFSVQGTLSTYANGKLRVVAFVKPYILNVDGNAVKVSGSTLLDESRRVRMTFKTTDGVYADGPLHLDEAGHPYGGIELLPGIQDLYKATETIRIVREGDLVSFKTCDLLTNVCGAPLGGKTWFEAKELKHKLRVEMLRRDRSVAGALAGSMTATLAIGAGIGFAAGGPVGALIGSAVSAVLGGMFEVGIGSEVLPDTKLWRRMELRKGTKRILKARQMQEMLFTDFDSAVKELDGALKKI